MTLCLGTFPGCKPYFSPNETCWSNIFRSQSLDWDETSQHCWAHMQFKGRIPDQFKISKILNWPPFKSLTEVQGFLGTCRVVQIFIESFAESAHPLVFLTQKICIYFGGTSAVIPGPFEETSNHSSCSSTLGLLISISHHCSGRLFEYCDQMDCLSVGYGRSLLSILLWLYHME